MHDIRTIRDNPAAFDEALARRNLPPQSPQILALDTDLRTAVTAQQAGQTRRNELSRAIGPMKRAGTDTTALEAEAAAANRAIAEADTTVTETEYALRALLASLPNRLDPEVPAGADEAANVLIHQRGTIPTFPFPPRQHFELGDTLGQMDFEAAARIAGARFTVLRGPLARLERALGQFMLDLHVTNHGYTECSVPTLVNDATLYGTGQLPKFAEDCFRTTDGRWLIPTAEVPLTNLAANQILPAATLPLRMAALTDCYRSEAGSAGRDTRGMLRQHQFRKVELVSIVPPDQSDAEHERMTQCAEAVLDALELPYRRMLLCAGDTGFSAARTYDLEVWLPGQAMWREISSCSTCTDFQSRRMNARLRPLEGKSLVFPHTLNGSGVAIGRALIAVMENHQTSTGAITIPAALRPYMADAAITASSD